MADIVKFADGAHKTCAKCNLSLPLDQFHRNKTKSLGRCELCKCCKFKANKKYYQSQAGKAAVSGQTKRKWIRVKDKVSARNAVSRALAEHRIARGTCEVCACKEVEAHHDDYSKPLEVRWLCRKHHLNLHGKTVNTEEFVEHS